MGDKVAGIWVFRRDQAALLQHRDEKPGLRHSGMWVPPGGHAKLGESIAAWARRELLEETEYDAPNLQFLLSLDGHYEDGDAFHATFFWCWYDETQPIVCHEGQELSFIKRSATADYSIPVYLFEVWDAAIAKANSITSQEESRP